MKFATIQESLEEIKKGKMLILLDNPDRENEGDFYIPADKATAKHITTMIKLGGGLICTAITKKQAFKLVLPMMVSPIDNSEKTRVNFTISVNAKEGITTGVSSFDRLKTVKLLANPKSTSADLTRPGHVFGLIAKDGGVLKRAGHTEAAVDLAKLAGLNPAGVLCEIIGDDGEMANLFQLKKLSKKLNIKIILIKDLVDYLKNNPLPKREDTQEMVKLASSKLPTPYGVFQILVYKSMTDNSEHTILTLGDLKEPVLTRIHSQCLTGDTLFSLKCDCGGQLKQSMELISKAGSGIILYLNQEGRGIGLANKIKAYALVDQGYDTVEANHKLGFPSDARQYKIAADILEDLKVSKIYLLTNNPKKEEQLAGFGITILKRVPLEIKPNSINKNYLSVKKQKLGHYLKLV